ncbi:MAG: hypothetical protein P8X95_21455, partial [Anaerolineales bacterium]
FHRPGACDTGFHQLRVGKTGKGPRERRPGIIESFEKLLSVHDSGLIALERWAGELLGTEKGRQGF